LRISIDTSSPADVRSQTTTTRCDTSSKFVESPLRFSGIPLSRAIRYLCDSPVPKLQRHLTRELVACAFDYGIKLVALTCAVELGRMHPARHQALSERVWTRGEPSTK